MAPAERKNTTQTYKVTPIIITQNNAGTAVGSPWQSASPDQGGYDWVIHASTDKQAATTLSPFMTGVDGEVCFHVQFPHNVSVKDECHLVMEFKQDQPSEYVKKLVQSDPTMREFPFSPTMFTACHVAFKGKDLLKTNDAIVHMCGADLALRIQRLPSGTSTLAAEVPGSSSTPTLIENKFRKVSDQVTATQTKTLSYQARYLQEKLGADAETFQQLQQQFSFREWDGMRKGALDGCGLDMGYHIVLGSVLNGSTDVNDQKAVLALHYAMKSLTNNEKPGGQLDAVKQVLRELTPITGSYQFDASRLPKPGHTLPESVQQQMCYGDEALDAGVCTRGTLLMAEHMLEKQVEYMQKVKSTMVGTSDEIQAKVAKMQMHMKPSRGEDCEDKAIHTFLTWAAMGQPDAFKKLNVQYQALLNSGQLDHSKKENDNMKKLMRFCTENVRILQTSNGNRQIHLHHESGKIEQVNLCLVFAGAPNVQSGPQNQNAPPMKTYGEDETVSPIEYQDQKAIQGEQLGGHATISYSLLHGDDICMKGNQDSTMTEFHTKSFSEGTAVCAGSGKSAEKDSSLSLEATVSKHTASHTNTGTHPMDPDVLASKINQRLQNMNKPACTRLEQSLTIGNIMAINADAAVSSTVYDSEKIGQGFAQVISHLNGNLTCTKVRKDKWEPTTVIGVKQNLYVLETPFDNDAHQTVTSINGLERAVATKIRDFDRYESKRNAVLTGQGFLPYNNEIPNNTSIGVRDLENPKFVTALWVKAPTGASAEEVARILNMKAKGVNVTCKPAYRNVWKVKLYLDS